jgi:hypothetical protein
LLYGRSAQARIAPPPMRRHPCTKRADNFVVALELSLVGSRIAKGWILQACKKCPEVPSAPHETWNSQDQQQGYHYSDHKDAAHRIPSGQVQRCARTLTRAAGPLRHRPIYLCLGRHFLHNINLHAALLCPTQYQFQSVLYRRSNRSKRIGPL